MFPFFEYQKAMCKSIDSFEETKSRCKKTTEILQPLREEFLTGCCAIVLIYDTFLKYTEYTNYCCKLAKIDVFFCLVGNVIIKELQL